MYTKLQEIVILLKLLKFSNVKIRKFYDYYADDDLIIDRVKTNPECLKIAFNDKEIKEIKNAILQEKHVKMLERLAKMRIMCVFYDSENYPKNLKNIDNEIPVVLFAIGDLSLLKQKMVAIIGTRKPSRYGKEITNKFVKDLCKSSVIPVSDLAYGIDYEVANAVVECKGKTIVLLAGGLDSIYPSSYTEIARKIVKCGGLLISEHLPGDKIQKSYFLERNKLLAGITDGLMVVEAGEKSATFNTVNYALSFGKELFVVPGNITSSTSVGTNKLISEMPHSFTISSNDILERFGVNIVSDDHVKDKININLSNEEKLIVSIVNEGEIHFDELQEKTKINTKTLATLLTMLEINGLIKKLPGNYYCV